MKKIVLVVLLVAAACGNKNKVSECDASIAKGIDGFTAALKSRGAANPQMQDRMMEAMAKLRNALTQRCTEDKWPPEVVSCFTIVTSMKDMQTCQSKLTEEQRAKLRADLNEVMAGMRAPRMPDGVPGHPSGLAGSGDPGAGNPGSAGGSAAPAGVPAPGVGPGGPANPTEPPPAGSAAPAGTPPATGSGSK